MKRDPFAREMTRRYVESIAKNAPSGEMALEDYEREVDNGEVVTDEPEPFLFDEDVLADFILLGGRR